ncbi:hypothetical protein H4P12_01270 [Paracoccus sp. 11-3]|uniref:Uncharacterized protein n=1 Tax=Paracoccus amoyensis TaxID=2760093 RepID=A0A926GDG8_9RHOB|nr:hypothetical protein [Paracoccus amoyensis]MBC9245369.1 hypothetical protein [Paracoccus amoyensis]
MSDGKQSLAVWGIAGLALLAIGLGLTITGGPLQGRKERRDAVRYEDLMRLAQQARCLHDADQLRGTGLGPVDACPDDVRAADPYTHQPYQITAVAPQHLRLCASFELTEDEAPWVRQYNQQWQGDCVVVELDENAVAEPR